MERLPLNVKFSEYKAFRAPFLGKSNKKATCEDGCFYRIGGDGGN